ncbi:MAG: hypothetical protein AAF639_31310 [Chloroflexota bacterium]
MNRADVLDILSQFYLTKGLHYQIRRIGIFGSVACDKMTEARDVD